MFRVGIGQDSHRFAEGKKLVLGGTPFDGAGMASNSDGDVVLHALCNAISSAIGSGSLSTYADEMCRRGITDSARYVEHILSEADKRGYQINNVSVAIECKTPKIEPKRTAMQERIAALLRIKPDAVGITATSGESLTLFGKGEGIQAFAIVGLNHG